MHATCTHGGIWRVAVLDCDPLCMLVRYGERRMRKTLLLSFIDAALWTLSRCSCILQDVGVLSAYFLNLIALDQGQVRHLRDYCDCSVHPMSLSSGCGIVDSPESTQAEVSSTCEAVGPRKEVVTSLECLTQIT